MYNFIIMDVKYIEDGVTINLAWVNVIAVSQDNVNWSLINKTGLSVGKYRKSINSTAPNNHAGTSSGDVVVLNDSEGEMIIKFDPTKVVNYSWATAQAAITEIGTWL